MTTQPNDRYLTRRAQAERYACSVRSIERWGKNPDLEFPPEIDVNGRKLRPLSALERWERKRAATNSQGRKMGGAEREST